MSNTQEKTTWFRDQKPVHEGVYETAGWTYEHATKFFRKWLGSAWSKCCRTLEEAQKQTRPAKRTNSGPAFWRGFTTKQD